MDAAAIATSTIIKSPTLTCSPKKLPSAVTVYVSPLSLAMLEPPVNAGELVDALYAPLYSNNPVATLSTYALVAASCAPVGSVTFCILALIPVVTKSYI